MTNTQKRPEIIWWVTNDDFPHWNVHAAFSTMFLSLDTDFSAVKNRGKDRIMPLKVTVLLVNVLSTESSTGWKILNETYM